MARLRRSSCSAPGIARRKHGRGFSYVDPDGERIDDPEVLERVAQLAIPPAWREVWICSDPRGHLQATGLDAAGRKQYRYHDDWRTHRDRQKFDSMIAFGKALPKLRRRVSRDLRDGAEGSRRSTSAQEERLRRERVLACAVRLLDVGFFRIGSDDYAERNASYGLTTMLRKHVRIEARELIFDFPAKSGQRRVQAITDDAALAVVAELKRRRAGAQLLAYREAERWVELDADEVNDYLKRYGGEDFSAKDFRTWNATVLAAVALAVREHESASTSTPRRTRASRERDVKAAIKTVAAYLGNTPAVCRASYVDPRVIDRYQAGVTIEETLAALPAGEPDLAEPRVRTKIESAVLELLAEAS
jgi:DNA topoisomerase-1